MTLRNHKQNIIDFQAILLLLCMIPDSHKIIKLSAQSINSLLNYVYNK
jgi:hypothetical protein